MELGSTIKRLRKEKGLKRKNVAEKAGISITALYNIENNLSLPTKENFYAICDAIKEEMSKPHLTSEIKPISQETADELDAAFKRFKDDMDRVNKILNPKDKTDVNK